MDEKKCLQSPVGLIFELSDENVFALFAVYSVVKQFVVSIGCGFGAVALLFVVRITL